MRLPRSSRYGLALVAIAMLCLTWAASGPSRAHVVPPEKLHPVADSFRRLTFTTRLNPVPWDAVEPDARAIAAGLAEIRPEAGEQVAREMVALIDEARADGHELGSVRRREIAAELLDLSTRAVATALQGRVERAESVLSDPARATRELEEARQLWAAFEPTVRRTDPEGYRRLGESWLELANSLGSPGLLGVGAFDSDVIQFISDADELIEYLNENFADGAVFSSQPLPAVLPPGSNTNKQLPRPRQVLNMADSGSRRERDRADRTRRHGVRQRLIFGEPARSLAITCNTCHNKSITNPGFFIPGLSARPGGMDVSNSFFAPHANNGHFDPVDIPDLRGIRFTSPYGAQRALRVACVTSRAT